MIANGLEKKVTVQKLDDLSCEVHTRAIEKKTLTGGS